MKRRLRRRASWRISSATLCRQLDACGFLRNVPKRPGMVRNLRHLFQRGEVTEQELRTLHGVVTELAHGRNAPGVRENSALEIVWRSFAPRLFYEIETRVLAHMRGFFAILRRIAEEPCFCNLAYYFGSLLMRFWSTG